MIFARYWVLPYFRGGLLERCSAWGYLNGTPCWEIGKGFLDLSLFRGGVLIVFGFQILIYFKSSIRILVFLSSILEGRKWLPHWFWRDSFNLGTGCCLGLTHLRCRRFVTGHHNCQILHLICSLQCHLLLNLLLECSFNDLLHLCSRVEFFPSLFSSGDELLILTHRLTLWRVNEFELSYVLSLKGFSLPVLQFPLLFSLFNSGPRFALDRPLVKFNLLLLLILRLFCKRQVKQSYRVANKVLLYLEIEGRVSWEGGGMVHFKYPWL